jgi:hypothetical protein
VSLYPVPRPEALTPGDSVNNGPIYREQLESSEYCSYKLTYSSPSRRATPEIGSGRRYMYHLRLDDRRAHSGGNVQWWVEQVLVNILVHADGDDGPGHGIVWDVGDALRSGKKADSELSSSPACHKLTSLQSCRYLTSKSPCRR